MRDKEQPIQIAFVGTPIPEEKCTRSPACSVAGNKFQLNLVRSVQRAGDCKFHVLSVHPVAMFPKSREWFVGAGTDIIDDQTSSQGVPFINLPVIKQLSIAWMIFCWLGIWLWRVRSCRRVVFVYNVFAPFSLPVLAATRLIGGKPVAVIADTAHGLYKYRGLGGLLEHVDFYAQTHSIANFAGVIALTEQIIHDFAPRLPSLVIEGGVTHSVVESDIYVNNSCDNPEEMICLFSGSLNEINGIDLLLHAFARIADANYRLWIFGDGPLRDIVQVAVGQDSRIVYWGRLPNEQVRKYQRQVTVLVNPRSSQHLITRYTFPSKLLEYMQSGRPVITALLPGLPAEYSEFVFPLSDETPNGLADLICRVCSLPPQELQLFGQKAQQFVLQNKNWDRQGHRIYEFISAL
jgi:glycosyltransferase involved in cell wall biosynthesis